MKNKEWLDEQNNWEDSSPEDNRLYDLLFSELAKNDDIEIPQSFADRVSQKALRRKILFFGIKIKLVYAAILSVIATFLCLFLAMDTSIEGDVVFRDFNISAYGIILGLVLVYFVIEISDTLFVKQSNDLIN